MGGEVAKDLTAGTFAGAAQLLVGHPFDTIKVKLQSQGAPAPGRPAKYAGAVDAVRKILAEEGTKGLYKGMGAPLATVAVSNAVLFCARGQMETLLRDHPGQHLDVGQQIIAGAGAGMAVSFVACPTELVKCKLQAQSALAAAGVENVAVHRHHYKGPMDVVKQVLRNEGGIFGLFKGLIPTLLRENVCCSGWTITGAWECGDVWSLPSDEANVSRRQRHFSTGKGVANPGGWGGRSHILDIRTSN
ncbi:mitochondrial carnitine/acylcarnitine carrier-like protein isoform X2 [Physcomitrium patens]|uniref:mitochondrial carnitine/acylcarnitine carrier-like protein isoform X2 n=1 Tax=Physcomitrium patens TaxID=3218 RepID=UPI000D15211F|nr:mitochondrial carnitine/acylcarnitine carrier-like protein isoform X2 [Physcomitrium patens]|eukprot:XP_024380901.1 mitochondrial carnitine/acylcarnitine carrier-like protein isoform X2 [Physcomitrella patens]